MADTDTSNTTTEATPATGAAPAPAANAQPTGSGERMFSQSEVNRIIAERVARAEQKSKPTATESNTQQATSKPAVPDTWALDFSDAVDAVSEETGAKVPLGLKKRMRDAYRVEAPTDPTAWVRGWMADVGIVSAAQKAPDTTTPNQSQAAAAQPSAPVPPNLVAPSGAANVDEITDPNEMMKPANFSRLVAKYGPDGARSRVARVAQQYLTTARVLPPPRK